MKNNKKRTIKCGHQYHNNCIISYFMGSNKCPNCMCKIYNLEGVTQGEQAKWIKIIYENYSKLFCKIVNYDKKKEYKIENMIFNDKIEQYITYHPEFRYGIMISLDLFYYNDYIGLYENEELIDYTNIFN